MQQVEENVRIIIRLKGKSQVVNLAFELLPGPLSISPNDANLEMNIWKANQVSLRTGLFHRARS